MEYLSGFDNKGEEYLQDAIREIIKKIGYSDIEERLKINLEKLIPQFDKQGKYIREDVDLGHEDNEPHMLKADLYRIGKYSMDLYKILDGFDDGETEFDFPHWWQSKIVKARLMLTSAKHYLDFELNEPEIDAMVNVASEEEIIDEEFVNITPNEESGEAVEAESDGPGY